LRLSGRIGPADYHSQLSDAWHTTYDVKSSAVTIRLEPEPQKLLDKVCKQWGRTRSDILREALKRQLSIIRFEQLRRQVLPFAEARGYLADEDVNKAVS
jgi:predicted transcriptional regulator